MNFRKGLLHIYETTLKKGNNGKISEFVKDRVCSILRDNFKNEDLKRFYILSDTESEILSQLCQNVSMLNFTNFIEYSNERIFFIFETIEKGLELIERDDDFKDKVSLLRQELNLIKSNSEKNYISKPEIENNFKQIQQIHADFIGKQIKFKSLIKDELSTNTNSSGNKKESNIEIEKTFLEAFENNDFKDFSINKTQKLLFKMNPIFEEFREGKIGTYNLILKLITKGKYLEAVDEFNFFVQREKRALNGGVLFQIKKISNIISRYKKNEEIPDDLINIFTFNLKSFGESLEGYIEDRIVHFIESKIDGYMSENFKECLGELLKISLVIKCFDELKINDIKLKIDLSNKLLERGIIDKSIFSFFKKENFSPTDTSIIELGREKIQKILNYTEKENLDEIKKSIFDKLGDKMDIIHDNIIKNIIRLGKVFIGSLGITGIILVKIIKIIKDVLTFLFSFLKKSAQSITKPIINIPIPPKLLKYIPQKYGGGGGGLDKLFRITIGDILGNILENGMFSADLRDGFNSKSNNVEGQQNLRNQKSDKLTGIDIINYDKLKNGLLVGEIFIDFKKYKWEKENIDFSDIHILESFDNNSNSGVDGDYSMFLDRFKWSLRAPTDKPTIMILDNNNLRKGRNSIVCPRGYLPILTAETKELLDEKGISYKLYCIKELGYFYLDLTEKPDFPIKIEFRRYGDEKSYGIFFSKENSESIGKHLNQFLSREELTQEIIDFMDSTKNLSDDEFMKAFVTYFKENFLYSKTGDTSKEHQKYKTHLSGVAHTKKGDCKNINTLAIGLARLRKIKSRLLAGYVDNGEGGYGGHGITEVDFGGKCRIYDSTPSKQAPEEEKEPDLIESTIERIKEIIGDSMISLKNNLKKVNVRLIVEELEKRFSILLARRVLAKKEQIEIYIARKNNGNYLNVINYDFMMLPNPIEMSKTLRVEDYYKFLKRYLVILNKIEAKLFSGNLPSNDIYKERLEKKKFRIATLKRVSDILGIEISYSNFMETYFENKKDIDVNKKVIFISILSKILVKKGIPFEPARLQLKDFMKKFESLGLENSYDLFIDFEEFENSTFEESIYLPLQPYPETDFNNITIIESGIRLIDTKNQVKNERINEAVKNALGTLYKYYENNSKFNKSDKINKENFLLLLKNTINEISSIKSLFHNFAVNIIEYVSEKKYEMCSLSISDTDYSPVLKLLILTDIGYKIINGYFKFPTIIDDNSMLENNYNLHCNNANNSDYIKYITKYINAFGEDEFINNIYLLLSTGIGITKFDTYLSQKSFISNPHNLLFTLRIIINDLKNIETKIDFYVDRGKDGEGFNWFEDQLSQAKESQKQFLKLKIEIKTLLINYFKDNLEIISETYKLLGIESEEDRDNFIISLNNLVKSGITDIEKYTAIINSFLDYDIKTKSYMGPSGFQTTGMRQDYSLLYEDPILSRQNIVSIFSSIPGEVLIKLGKKYIADEKLAEKLLKKAYNNPETPMEDTRSENNLEKKIKNYSIILSALKRAKFKSNFDSIISKNVIYKLEEKIQEIKRQQLYRDYPSYR
ncbi:transglutaminase-like domain-containing protein [Candidatus Gracilibacteria bacterium]|nr:transglutaminase-like domain-containing protein [Candidatus Gracilibacteria bacterium]